MARFLTDPRFPSDGTIPRSVERSFSRVAAFAWDVSAGRQDRSSAAAPGIYYARQNMLSQVGSVTTNGIQQKSDFRDTPFTAFADMPVWPNLLAPSAVRRRHVSAVHRHPRVRPRLPATRASTASTSGSSSELAPSMAAYVDFTVAKSVHLTRFLNYNVHGTAAAAAQPATRDTTTYTGANPFGPALGDVFVTNSRGHGLYRGAHVRPAQALLDRTTSSRRITCSSKDEDDDSNERDPFTDRSFNFYDLEPRLRAVGPRHPAQGQLLHLRRAAAAVPGQRCACRGGRRSRSRRRRAC